MNYQRPIVACLITIFLLSVSTLSLGDETTVSAEQKQKSANHADPNAKPFTIAVLPDTQFSVSYTHLTLPTNREV